VNPAEPIADFSPVELALRDGRRVTLRAVRPEDRDEFQAAFSRLSEESRYTRFMSAVRELSPQTLERAIRPDEASELQLIAVAREGGREQIVAGARYAAEPGGTSCEFAVTVTDSWQGLGLARELLAALMRTARTRGFKQMNGYILASNTRMLSLAKRLGFVQVPSPEDPSVRLLRCDLARAP
jgi:RimJ/RimL family protein N-acetyltransferase